MRTTKKGISGILVLCLMLVGLLMPTQAMAASDSGTYGDIKWEISEKVLTLSAVSGTQGEMKEYAGGVLPWCESGQVNKIVINEGVKTITAYAFENIGARDVVLPKSIKHISLDAFSTHGGDTIIIYLRNIYGYRGTYAETFAEAFRKEAENGMGKWEDHGYGMWTLAIYGDGTIDRTGKITFIAVEDTSPSTSTGLTATPTSSKVLVNGKTVAFDAYTINENNYFKLRDVAKVLSGSGNQFEVTWDNAKKAINLVSGKSYTVVGGELAKGDGTTKNAVPCTSAMFKDGSTVTLTAYTINGNNYFKLRDLGNSFGFGVEWNATHNSVVITTTTASPDEQKSVVATYVGCNPNNLIYSNTIKVEGATAVYEYINEYGDAADFVILLLADGTIKGYDSNGQYFDVKGRFQ